MMLAAPGVPMNDPEITQEFLIESTENLSKLDQDMVRLEQDAQNAELIANVFRTIHTIKGTCGFLGFTRLETLTHIAEDILSEVRDGVRILDAPLTTLVLDTVDAIRRILRSIEAGEGEGPIFELNLISRLEQARDRGEEVPGEANGSLNATQGVGDGGEAQSSTTAEPQGSRAPSPARSSSGGHHSTLRVDVGLLDRLMNLVGELVLVRNQLVQHHEGQEDSALTAISQSLSLITGELQEGVMKTRMQPIGVLWNKLPRMVRDLAANLGKQIALEMDGETTELDRTIIEAIKDPLTHIIRNSCDHGIEAPPERLAKGKHAQGRLILHAWHEGGQVNIEIADDGAGIDPVRVKRKALERGLISEDQALNLSDHDAVNLVFLPGFSTASAVTSISGRGVGMDVVRTQIERIGGLVDLTGQPGQGTTVRIRIPLTLAIMPGLLVQAGGEQFVIPQVHLHELIQTGEGAPEIEYVHSVPVLRHRNVLLPLADLCGLLHLEPQRRPGEAGIVVLQADHLRFGLIVDAICDSQEIVVKPLGLQLQPLTCYAGATIMGDGQIALILDIAGVASRAGMVEASRPAAGLTASVTQSESGPPGGTSLLLFRTGEYQRVGVSLSRVARLERIRASAIEQASGRPVIQYRGRILPLLDLCGAIERPGRWDEETLPVIVFRSGAHELGLVVDEISDVADEPILDPRGSHRNGLLGSAVVGGLVTDLVDLDALAEDASWLMPRSMEQLAAALSPVTTGPQVEEVQG